MKPVTSRFLAALIALVSTFWLTGAHAALMNERFDVMVLAGGPGAGESGLIDIEWDSSLLFFGDEILADDEFAFSMTLFGQTFGNRNDIGFGGGFPRLGFLDFSIEFIDFVIQEFDFINPTPIIDPRVEEIGGGDIADRTLFVRTFGPATVPLPGTFALLMAGLVGGGFARRLQR